MQRSTDIKNIAIFHIKKSAYRNYFQNLSKHKAKKVMNKFDQLVKREIFIVMIKIILIIIKIKIKMKIKIIIIIMKMRMRIKMKIIFKIFFSEQNIKMSY